MGGAILPGADEDAVISYGSAPDDRKAAEERVRLGVIQHGQRAAARAARLSLRDVTPGGPRATQANPGCRQQT